MMNLTSESQSQQLKRSQSSDNALIPNDNSLDFDRLQQKMRATNGCLNENLEKSIKDTLAQILGANLPSFKEKILDNF